MTKWNHQLKEWEVYEIWILLKEWYSIPKIAEKVWRHKTTIYRLLKNNWIAYNETKYKYIWWRIGNTKKVVSEHRKKVGKKKIQFQARTIFLQRKARRSLASKRYCRIEQWSKEEKYILEKIQNYYSPEQISWKRALENKTPLSKDTIYSYIYTNHSELICKYFRRKWKKYQHKRKQKYQLDQRRMIDKRPKSIERRTTLWHWEADTVVGKRKTKTKKCIFTCVERKSWFLIARVLENSQAEHLAMTVIEEFKSFPKYKKKTMTVDNGREFARHYDIEREVGMNVYFAHPYCSRERGTNENTNWLLRQFLPKGTDFENVNEKELQKYVDLINNRPRKRLKFLSPHQVFFKKKKSCIWL